MLLWLYERSQRRIRAEPAAAATWQPLLACEPGADMARVEDLASDGSVSIRERNQTLAELRSSEAQVDAARAHLDPALIHL